MDSHPAGVRGCAECASEARCSPQGGCTAQLSLDPRQLTAAERRLWLEQYRRHLEERLAEVNRQLAEL